MSKKKKNKATYVDPYEAAYLRAQEKIENTTCDVSDNVMIDENGDPVVVNDRDYIYEDQSDRDDSVTPSYMDFIMNNKREKKKRKKPENTKDYDLITEDDAPLNTAAEIDRIAKKGLGNQNPEPEDGEDEMAPVDIPDDLKEMFPDMFDNVSGGMGSDDGATWFGPDDTYDDPYPEEETIEEADENREIEVHVNINPKTSGDMSAEEELATGAFHQEPDAVPDVDINPTEPEAYKPDWMSLSRICALHFRICEPLGRMIIDDGLAPSPVINTVMNTQCYDVNQPGLKETVYGDDGKLDLTYINKVETALWLYIVSSKHPAAVYTEEEYMEAFADIDAMDNKNFVFIYDDRHLDTLGPMVYAYHIPANENRYFNNYVKSSAKGFTNDPDFYPGYPSAERDVLAQLLVKVHIAEYIKQEREIFPSHLDHYLTTFRMTKDEAGIPAFNRLLEFTALVRIHRKTEIGDTIHPLEDVQKITSIYDFHYIRDVVFDIYDVVDGVDEDDDDEEDDDIIMPPTEDSSETVPMPPIEDEDDIDPMQALSEQIGAYADDEKDYTALIDDQITNHSVMDMADTLYEEYAKTAKEQGKPVLTKEQLAARMQKGVVGSMSAIRKTDGSADIVVHEKETAEPAVETKTEPEQVKNDVGSNTMMEALKAAGASVSETKAGEEKPTSLGSVPVFRK